MTQHTPGPWIVHNLSAAVKAGNVRPGADGTVFRITADRTLCIELRADSDGYVIGENAANARLIAAAPDMLEALHKIENWLSASFIATPQDMAQSFEEMYWTARHAIAKAKGESAE